MRYTICLLNFLKILLKTRIVDSRSLFLNIPKKYLQRNRILKMVGENIIRKNSECFYEILRDDENFIGFYKKII